MKSEAQSQGLESRHWAWSQTTALQIEKVPNLLMLNLKHGIEKKPTWSN